MNQEKIQMLNSLNEKHEVLTEQIKMVEQQIKELTVFNEELNIIKAKKDEEMFAPIGKSVYAPVKMDSSKKLLVEVGAGYFVKKDITEAMTIASEQRQRLESFRLQITAEIDDISEQLEKIII